MWQPDGAKVCSCCGYPLAGGGGQGTTGGTGNNPSGGWGGTPTGTGNGPSGGWGSMPEFSFDDDGPGTGNGGGTNGWGGTSTGTGNDPSGSGWGGTPTPSGTGNGPSSGGWGGTSTGTGNGPSGGWGGTSSGTGSGASGGGWSGGTMDSDNGTGSGRSGSGGHTGGGWGHGAGGSGGSGGRAGGRGALIAAAIAGVLLVGTVGGLLIHRIIVKDRQAVAAGSTAGASGSSSGTAGGTISGSASSSGQDQDDGKNSVIVINSPNSGTSGSQGSSGTSGNTGSSGTSGSGSSTTFGTGTAGSGSSSQRTASAPSGQNSQSASGQSNQNGQSASGQSGQNGANNSQNSQGAQNNQNSQNSGQNTAGQNAQNTSAPSFADRAEYGYAGTYVSASAQNLDIHAGSFSGEPYTAANNSLVYVDYAVEDGGTWYGHTVFCGLEGWVRMEDVLQVSRSDYSIGAGDQCFINNTYNEGIALRSGPDVSYDLLTRVPYGTEVAVEAFSGGWGKISWSGQTGWIKMQYLGQFYPELTYQVCTGGSPLGASASPSASGSALASVDDGTLLGAGSRQGGWMAVSAAGASGWVQVAYLKAVTDTQVTPAQQEAQQPPIVIVTQDSASIPAPQTGDTSFYLDGTPVGTDGYIIPDSSSRYLTQEDLDRMTLKGLCYAKNEIYARYGRGFKAQELQQYFGSRSWYRAIHTPSDDTDRMIVSQMNAYESYNKDLLWAEEQRRGTYSVK